MKVSCKNIEKWLRNRKSVGIDYADVGIELIFIRNVKFRLTLNIQSWFHSKILTFDQIMGQNLSYLVCMTKYGHKVFCS